MTEVFIHSKSRPAARFPFPAAVLTLSLLLAACGGGGGGSSTLPTTSVKLSSVALAIQGVPVKGVADSFPLSVAVKDANGNVITGAYPAPVTITDTDTSGATYLTTSTTTSSHSKRKTLSTVAPSTSVTINDSHTSVVMVYNGGTLSTPVTVSVSAPGVSSSPDSAAFFDVNKQRVYPKNVTLTYAQTYATHYVSDALESPPPDSLKTNTRAETYTTGETFNGQAGLVKIHDVITAVSPTPKPNESQVTDTYLSLQQTGNSATVSMVGQENMRSYGTVGGAGYESYDDKDAFTGYLSDKLPQTAGSSWYITPASQDNYTMSISSPTNAAAITNIAFSEKQNADGSYTNSNDILGPSYRNDYVTAVNPDGTASVQHGFARSSTNYVDTFAPGVPVISNGASVIPIHHTCQTGTAAPPSPAPAATPAPSCFSNIGAAGAPVMSVDETYGITNWYPNGLPTPIRVDKMTVLGDAPIPSKCGVPASIGTSASHEHEDYTGLDPSTMSYETTAGDYYFVSGIGLACYTITTDEKDYDFVSGSLDAEVQYVFVAGLQNSAATQSLLRTQGFVKAQAMLMAGGFVTAKNFHHATIDPARPIGPNARRRSAHG